jgi:hypothetical protein
VSEWPAFAPGRARRGPRQTLAAVVRGFLLEPPEAERPDTLAPAARRPVIAVFGLASRCGTTVVARAIGATLAVRDPTGACVVACETKGSGPPLATPAATRLARALEDLPGGTRALGRLCLVRGGDPCSLADALPGLAPLVLDVGSSALGGAAASVADRALIVTTPAIEPALARVAAECVARVGPEPLLVMNRAGRGAAPEEQAGTSGAAAYLPETRLGAHVALSGRAAGGMLGRAVAALVDRWEGGRWEGGG